MMMVRVIDNTLPTLAGEGWVRDGEDESFAEEWRNKKGSRWITEV